MPRVAFQGEAGAFSDEAARTLVPGAQTAGYGTFDEAAGAIQAGEADFALLPVENSLSGSVPRVYDVLWSDERLTIVDEIVFPVVQNLVALPGARLAEIREARSHPVALEQCRAFLRAHPHVRPIVVADTAGAARDIVRLRDPRVAAIASAFAAQLYGAHVLVPAIQDAAENFTRFFLLQRDGTARAAEPSRACVALSLANRPGSLRDALGAFADVGLDLRTLVSRPSLERPFTYRFYCEIARATRTQLDTALARIEGEGRVLGFY